MSEIYLDNNATTRPLPEVAEAMLEVLSEGFGNASSVHSAGERARRRLCDARTSVAKLLGAEPESVVFTSSGTEANNQVLLSPFVNGSAPGRLVTTPVEHSSVLKAAEYLAYRGVEVVFLSVDQRGRIDLEELEAETVSETALVSVQWVN